MSVVTAIVLLIASVVRPDSASCTPHWWLSEGVHLDGSFVCAYLPAERWEDHQDKSADSAAELAGHIYCTGGTSPVVVRGVAVSCQPGGWR